MSYLRYLERQLNVRLRHTNYRINDRAVNRVQHDIVATRLGRIVTFHRGIADRSIFVALLQFITMVERAALPPNATWGQLRGTYATTHEIELLTQFKDVVGLFVGSYTTQVMEYYERMLTVHPYFWDIRGNDTNTYAEDHVFDGVEKHPDVEYALMALSEKVLHLACRHPTKGLIQVLSGV